MEVKKKKSGSRSGGKAQKQGYLQHIRPEAAALELLPTGTVSSQKWARLGTID